jgi:glycosyltransferase involved in cell wall biosynthesis
LRDRALTPGNLEVVGDTAVTFSHSEPEKSLAAAIKKISDDPGLAAEFGGKARRRIQAHYDWETICDRYEALFQKMTAKKT